MSIHALFSGKYNQHASDAEDTTKKKNDETMQGYRVWV